MQKHLKASKSNSNGAQRYGLMGFHLLTNQDKRDNEAVE